MRWTLGLGSGLTVLGTLAIALTTDFWLLGALMLRLGFSTGIGQPVTMAWVTRISPKDVRGLAISIRLTSNRLGQVVIPAVAGVLAATSAGTVFLLLAGLQGLSFIVSERALGKKPPADE
jgi:MFS family permease